MDPDDASTYMPEEIPPAMSALHALHGGGVAVYDQDEYRAAAAWLGIYGFVANREFMTALML